MFNSFLDKLHDSYKSNAAKHGFWMQLMQAGIAPVHDGEVIGAGVSQAQSLEYVRVHGTEQQPVAGEYCRQRQKYAEHAVTPLHIGQGL